MYRIHASLLLMLLSLIYECGSFGLVYRTGCCPTADLVPDIAKRTPDFIEGFGYGVEIHEIVTPDGYILTMHRVLPKFPASLGNPPVILQHGIAGSSVLWVLNQERSLPFLLTDDEFDTWLLDTRGNSYSDKHVYLRPADSDFWKFSFHEQGTIDLATAVDYVLNVTNSEKTFFVGHSRGTTMALALLSTRPEYNSKFYLLSLFAPVAYIRHIANPLLRAVFDSGILPVVEGTVRNVGAYQIPGSSVSAIQLREILCNRTQIGCMTVIFSFSGFDYELLNRTNSAFIIPVALGDPRDDNNVTKAYAAFVCLNYNREVKGEKLTLKKTEGALDRRNLGLTLRVELPEKSCKCSSENIPNEHETMIPIYLSHYPEGGAVQEYLHYIQIAKTDEFIQFNHGAKKNLEIYGTRKPPLYDLTQITAPIALYHGDNDFFVTSKDRIRLTKQLGSVVADTRIAFKKFTHMDFLWATKADFYVYNPAIEFMKQFISS